MKNIPETSREAFESLKPEDIRQTYKDILHALKKIGEGTQEDIAFQMRVAPSKVWKRMLELIRMELVYKPGTKKPLRSGRKGFIYKIKDQNSFSHYANQILENQFIKPQQSLF